MESVLSPDSQINDSKDKGCTEKPQKQFSGYLISERKKELIEELKKILCGKKGKTVAILLCALKIRGLIAFTDGEKKSLYNSMRVVFGDIGSDESINKYLNEQGKEKGGITKKLTLSEIEPYIEQIKKNTVV